MLMWQFWLIVAGIFFIGEIFTAGFLIFWVGIGALLAMITSIFTDNLIIQTAVFVFSSGLLLFLTRPFVNKYVRPDKDGTVTNAKSVIGRKAIVTEDIDPLKSVGLVKVGEEVWSAISANQELIPKDTRVEIVDLSGVKVVVEPIDSSNEARKTVNENIN